VQATVREGGRVYTNVAIHLKGSYTFQPIDAKPSLTLNFDKFAPAQHFHGLTKIHLNNSVQDPSFLSEQLARELFAEVGVPSPRAGHAFVALNGRDLDLFVMIEGANKQFVKRNFKSAKGNLYDGGSGGDVTAALKADCGEDTEDHSDLNNLVKAAREPDPAKRLAQLEKVLDVEEFINFAATEAFILHWDGYSIGCNNYRLFHDTTRDKMVFIPQGMDQLFGTSRPVTSSITPPFKGLVAEALFSIPQGRQRYLKRLEELSTNEFRLEALYPRVDRLAEKLRPALANSPRMLSQFAQAVQNLKMRMAQRAASVAQQLSKPERPMRLAQDENTPLSGWSFKSGPTQSASGTRAVLGGRDVLQVTGNGPGSSGSWRKAVLLDEGHYEFSGLTRTQGVVASEAPDTSGVILRVSGERSSKGITVSTEWKTLTYEFDVRGIQEVELICEFRGQGTGCFDAGLLRLARRGLSSDHL